MSGSEKGFVYSKLVRVNSANALANTKEEGKSLTDWVVDFGTTCQQVKRISFISCIFNNNAYNINGPTSSDPNYLGTYQIDRNGGPDVPSGTISISEGFYNTPQLLTAIQTALQSILTTAGFGELVTFTQDSLTNKVTVTYSQGTLISGTLTLKGNSNPGIQSLWRMIGFDVSNGAVFTIQGPGSVVAPYFPSLSGLRQVYLKSDILAPGYQIDEKGSFQNVAINIPITASYGAVNVWECKQDTLCEITYSTPRNLQRVDFRLTDEDGSIVDLHGSSVKVELKIWSNKV